jgi:hypothetical protein
METTTYLQPEALDISSSSPMAGIQLPSCCPVIPSINSKRRSKNGNILELKE